MRGSGDFSIGSKLWPGLSKVIEECGELAQVAGKLMGTGGVLAHWDGSNLKVRLEEEIADVIAACIFFVEHNAFDAKTIGERVMVKIKLFDEWHAKQTRN